MSLPEAGIYKHSVPPTPSIPIIAQPSKQRPLLLVRTLPR